jgi:hypothetical protein
MYACDSDSWETSSLESSSSYEELEVWRSCNGGESMESQKRRERILSILSDQIKNNEILSMFEGGEGVPTRSAPAAKPKGKAKPKAKPKGKAKGKAKGKGKPKGKGKAKKKERRGGAGMLHTLSTKQLRKEAKRAGIDGYASMGRRELLKNMKYSMKGGAVIEGPGMVIRKRLKVGSGASQDEIIEKLDRLKMPQLNSLAKKANIVGYSRKTKTPLVTMLARYAQ